MIESARNINRSPYRKYPAVVRAEVARTGNIYLFPNLSIPRTTAQYWVKKESQLAVTSEQMDSLYRQKCESLEQELGRERALRKLVESIRKIFPFDFQTKYVKSKVARTEIVAAIQECKKLNKLSTCLSAIGLSKSSYQRWASEVSFCASTKSPCQRRRPTQLTEAEVAVMKKFVTSYNRYYSWSRPSKTVRKVIKKTGIRVLAPNLLWHVDVTVVNLCPGRKLYIQAVIDNFSRYVVAWRVSDFIGADGTIELLTHARKNAATMEKIVVLTDPGSENNNHAVTEFTVSRNMQRVLARVEVHYSNSMIESLFRMLKNNFLYHQDIRNIQDLERKARFYFTQHYEVIPQAVLAGATPVEFYRRLWTEKNESRLKSQRAEAVIARRAKNLSPPCHLCPANEIPLEPPKNSADQVQNLGVTDT
jgi:putative transposase